jgi:DNA-directed RNA polymerase specialized sigma24 family protein
MSQDNQHLASSRQDLDPEHLARVIKSAQDPGVREQAAADLLKIVQHLAKRIVIKLGLALRDGEEVSDDAASHVLTMLCECRFNPERGRFVPWASRVAKNYITDELRRRQREMPESQVPISAELRRKLEEAGVGLLDWLHIESEARRGRPTIAPDAGALISIFHLPFIADDLQTISEWHPLRDRIIMLVLSGLWCKVPEPLWREWVEAAQLPWPFPPEEIIHLDDKQRRVAPLAEAMGLTRNHLCVIWNRRIGWLKNLRCIRELAEAYGHGNVANLGRLT